MAEREGFEPSEPMKVHLISSQARSASSGTSPIISLPYSLNLASSGSLDFTRHIPVPRLSGVAMQRAIWPSCHIVESSPLLWASCPSSCGPAFGRSKLFPTIWSASSGTSPGVQILIDRLHLEYNGISSISGNPQYTTIINELAQLYETSLKLRKPNDIWLGNIRLL